jgi:hypothetical protein
MISDSLSPATASISSVYQTPRKKDNLKLTRLALIPIHHQRPDKRIPIRLQPPHRIRLVTRTLHNLPWTST